MKREYSNERKACFIILVLISFIAIYIYNILTPLMSDDLLFDRSLYQSLGDIFREEYKQYLNWNGRSVLQIILKIFSILPLGVFQFCNSVCFVMLGLLVYWNVNPRKKYDCFLYVLIQLCIWNFCVDFSQTMLWLSGACNYLWGITIILGFITLYKYFLKNNQNIKNRTLVTILMFVPGVLAGWGNENTSGGAVMIVFLLSAVYFYEHKKIEKWMVSGFMGMLIGLAFMVLAPGNASRSAVMKMAESHSGFAAYISRGLKVLKAIDQYLLLYVIVICLLGAYFYYTRHKLREFIEVAVYALAALATAAVLIFTPEPMPRAYFGANVYMMIAALQMVQLIRHEDTLLISLKTGGIIAASIWMCFTYIEEGANLGRILREVNEREEYIHEQVEAGNRDLTLPMLRPQFETKYSYMYDSDISMEEDYWMNDVYCIKYDLDSVTAVPRAEWTEY